MNDTSNKTRRRSCNAFKKFSHSTEDYVIPRLIAISSDKLTEQEVFSIVKSMVDDKTCYYMDEWGGEEMPLIEAIEKVFHYLGASIVVYKDRFAIIKKESEIGAPLKYILVNK